MTPERRTLLRETIAVTEPRRWESRKLSGEVVATAELLAELAEELLEASDRETPEDTSHDAGPLDLEALANSEAVQAIINLRLAQERVRMLEDCRRRLGWVSVVSSVAGIAVGIGLAVLFWPG